MARAFAACHEFNSRALLPSTTAAGKHFTVEVNCSTTELTTMIERIVNAWKWFGETEPYWSVLTNDAFKAANIAGHLDAFYESGRRDISRLVAALCRNQVDEKAIKNVIDFGCGVGRLALALASRFPHVTGIDVSPRHIELAEQRATEYGFNNVAFHIISHPNDLDSLVDIDLITCLIVLQHNPPPVIAEMLRKLLNSLKGHGIAYFQIPTFISDYQFYVEGYLKTEQPKMEMHALPQKEVYRIIRQCRCSLLEVREDSATGSSAMISQSFLVKKDY
jgi:SAM-dependent methyltransferase